MYRSMRRATLFFAALAVAAGYFTPRDPKVLDVIGCETPDAASVAWTDPRCGLVGASRSNSDTDEVDEGASGRTCLCLKCEAGGLFCPSSMMSCVNSNCTPLQPIVSP